MSIYFKIPKSDWFCKNWLSDFLCYGFLIEMHGLLQNYTFEICTLSKIMNICCKTGWSLFTSDKKEDTWFRTHLHWFATVVLTWFLFSSLIYINIKCLKSIPPNIVSCVGKTIGVKLIVFAAFINWVWNLNKNT